MWDDVESASALNRTNIFQDVYYHTSVNQLSYEQFNRFMNSTQTAIDELAKIKYIPGYCQFVSKKTGYNLEKGFSNLEKTPLVLTSPYIKENYAGIDIKLWDEFCFVYSLDLNISPSFFTNRIDSNLSSTLAHEMGELLIKGATIPNNRDQFMNKAVVPRNLKNDWKREFAADKIAVASNSDHDCGLSLAAYYKSKESRLNKAYIKGLIPDPLTDLVSSFCLARDEMLFNTLNKYAEHLSLDDKKLIGKILYKLDLHPSDTHPPPISRAIESDRFAIECRNFLNTPKPSPIFP